MEYVEKSARKSLGAKTEDELMMYIQKQRIEPGRKIPTEYELAEMFHVGRSTVREAVKGLVSRGILEVRRGDGTYVINTIPLNTDPFGFGKIENQYQLTLNLIDVRLMLEPEIAALACRNATDEELIQLQKLCDETERLYLSGRNHIEKDLEFHACIAKCSKNQIVEMLIPMINAAIINFANLTHKTLKDETIDTHRAITRAILQRDMVGAKGAMSMHLTYNRQRVLELLKNNESV